jgi:DNA-binding protein HU-beta
VNKAELADAVAADLDISRKQALEAIDSVLDNIVHAVVKDDKVSLVGFGTFEKARRAARNGRNPQTGAVVKIPATSVPKFKAGAEFKGLVSGKKKASRK